MTGQRNTDHDRIEQLVVMVLEAVDQRLRTALDGLRSDVATCHQRIAELSAALDAHVALATAPAATTTAVMATAPSAPDTSGAALDQPLSAPASGGVVPPFIARSQPTQQVHTITHQRPEPPAIVGHVDQPPTSAAEAIDLQQLTEILTRQLSGASGSPSA